MSRTTRSHPPPARHGGRRCRRTRGADRSRDGGSKARLAVSPAAVSAAQAHSCLVMTGSGDPAFTKNFNPFTSTGLPSGQFIKGAMYEGLTVSPEGGKPTLPWLAQSWKWSNSNKTLTLNLAKGVKWSDGKPLTSVDVVYSLTAGRQNKVMDIIGYTRPDTNIASIKAKGANAVVINLKTADSQFIAANLNLALIVPRHIWSHVSDPATFTNPNPVGTGPFTKITRFTSQDYVFSKNPHYWQPGKPLISCLEYVQAASNDAALALLQSGQVDWTHNFVPNVEKAYESKDKAHFHSFYATTAYPVSLVFDNTAIRTASWRSARLSHGDRPEHLSKLGEYGYAPPTDALGLNGLFPQWVTDPAVKAQAKALATYNPTAAKKLLTDAGFTYKGNQLVDPKGNPVNLDIHVISGWSDWVASNQIITKNLQAIGIDSNVKLEPDWDSWFPNAYATKNPTLLWQNGSQGSPYGFFNANLSQNAFPVRVRTRRRPGNWSHTYEREGDRPAEPVEGHPRREEAAGDRDAAREALPADHADRPALHRAPLVDVQHEVLPLLQLAEELLRRPDLHARIPDNLLSFTRICPGGKAGA